MLTNCLMYNMRVLGIDPGTATIGFGVVDVSESDIYKLVDYGLVETDKSLPHGQRLELIYTGISRILETHKPDVVSIERLFFATNALTAIAVGQAIGVIKLAVHRQSVPAFDYTPMQLKAVISGNGRADKKLIQATVKKMFNIKVEKGKKTHFDDTADAIALAVCHIKKINEPTPPKKTSSKTRPLAVKV